VFILIKYIHNHNHWKFQVKQPPRTAICYLRKWVYSWTETEVLNLLRSDFKYPTDFGKSDGFRWIRMRIWNPSHPYIISTQTDLETFDVTICEIRDNSASQIQRIIGNSVSLPLLPLSASSMKTASDSQHQTTYTASHKHLTTRNIAQ